MTRFDSTRTTPLVLGSLCGLLGLLAPTSADAAVAYIRSNVSAPWGQTVNEEAMDMAFGIGAWDDLRYETVDPMVLYSPMYTFIYMEGSDSNALELQAFMMANQAALEAWVTAGGALFLNAAPNEGGAQNWGFGGVVLDYNNSSVDPGTAVDPMHPIWAGPFLPTVDMWTGSSYAHAAVNGPGLVPLIEDSTGDVQLAELQGFGSGHVLFGGLTTSNFWTPAPESLNLRANMISYLTAVDTDMDGLNDFADNCPEIANPMQEDMDMDGFGDVCDVCPADDTNDADMDMACDMTDNCPGLANPMQMDNDMDGLGNLCDECPDDPDDDVDNDTICGDIDNCPEVLNVNQADDDMDGIGNLCDMCPDDPGNDPDEDMICAAEDNCPDDANPDQADEDGDGVGDACDDPVSDSSGEGGMDDTTGGGSEGGESGAAESTGGPIDPGTDSAMGGSTGDASATSGAADDGADPSGCGCTTRPAPGAAGWLLLLGGLGLRRRRRAS